MNQQQKQNQEQQKKSSIQDKRIEQKQKQKGFVRDDQFGGQYQMRPSSRISNGTFGKRLSTINQQQNTNSQFRSRIPINSSFNNSSLQKKSILSVTGDQNILMSQDSRKIIQQKFNQLRKMKQNDIQRQLMTNSANNNSNNKKSIDQLFKNNNIQSIVPYVNQKYISNNAPVSNTVKMLDMYNQRFGLLPMGQIYQNTGQTYIGRKIRKTQDGKSKLVALSSQKIACFIQTPDLGRNICYFANKATQKWNDFVKSQNQLKNYLNKIDTPDKQKQHSETLVKQMSMGTLIYKILATLYYFYVDLEQNILKIPQKTAQNLRKGLKIKSKLKNIPNILSNLMGPSWFRTPQTRRLQQLFDYIDFYVNTIKQSTTPQLYKQIQSYIQDSTAYLDQEMLGVPQKAILNWVQNIKKQNINANLFSTQYWNPQAQYFKAGNYLML